VHLNAGETEWREQIVLRGEVGRRVLTCACTTLPGDDDHAPGFVVVFDDITALLQAQRDAAWGEVARRLAHEIKNPTYTGFSPEFWRSCDAVGDERSYVMLGSPNCGKGEPGEVAHVGHAVPGARVRNVRVGVGRW
jgi:hypothetical protein